MKSLKNQYEGVFVVTYGRSGSTLLQGILNTIPGYRITGENYNFAFKVFESYQALVDVKEFEFTKNASSPSHPYYGVPEIDLEEYLQSCATLIYNTLVPSGYRSTIKRFGFKEIRYMYIMDKFEPYLSFLMSAFPNSKIIFNLRSLDDVMKSAWWARADQVSTRIKMERADTAFMTYVAENPDHSFLIRYEDVVANNGRVADMFDFLGAAYVASSINETLGIEHSSISALSQKS